MLDPCQNYCDQNLAIKAKLKLSDVPILTQPHCKIKDPVELERKLNDMLIGGTERLQVVSDFDFTITKQRTDSGAPVLSSFGMFNECKSLPATFVKAAQELHDIYRPIEINPHLPKEEKAKRMIEWWTKSSNLLSGFPLNIEELDEIACRFKNSLRDHSYELFATLYRLNVPVLVFSAGMGNCVVSVLRQANVLFPNVKAISNFLKFKDGLVDGFQEPIIHTFNKNESVLIGSEYYDLVHDRDHVIVMGDSLADAGMADGVPSSSHIIKIGFLYDHIEENLQQYMDTFDIVLVDDQTMNTPRALIALIERYNSTNNEITNGTTETLRRDSLH